MFDAVARVNRFGAAFLAISYILSQSVIDRNSQPESGQGDLVAFLSGTLFFVISFLWPLLLRISLMPELKSIWNKALIVMGGIFFAICIIILGANFFLGFDYDNFFNHSDYGGYLLVAILLYLFVLYGSFYVLDLEIKEDPSLAIWSCLKYQIVFLFFPLGVFYVVSKLQNYRTCRT